MKAMIEAMQGILSYQTIRYGYIGTVVTPKEYILIKEEPWNDFADPGCLHELRGVANKQHNQETQYQTAKSIYISQKTQGNPSTRLSPWPYKQPFAKQE